MKILTILIFSGDRVSVNELLSDIAKINQSNLNIRLVDWGKDKKILKRKNQAQHPSIRVLGNSLLYRL